MLKFITITFTKLKSTTPQEYLDFAYRCSAPFTVMLVALERYFLDNFNIFIIISIAIIAIAVAVFHFYFCEPTIKSLRKELDSVKEKNDLIGDQVRYLFEGYLYKLSKKLNFGKKASNDERMTIYLHQGHASRFVPFGRVSANPKFATQVRSQYPDDEGCIAKGWENGWHFDNKLGTGKFYKINNRDKYKMGKETINNIRMQSQLYAVKRIDADGEKLAVLVVESMESNRFTRKKLKEDLEHEEVYLSEMILKLRDFIPIFNYAKGRGF